MSPLDLPPGTLDYYLICNETCHDNPFANAQFNASQSLDSIDLFRRSISNYTASNQQPGSGVGPIQVCICMCICVCASLCMYVCVCVCCQVVFILVLVRLTAREADLLLVHFLVVILLYWKMALECFCWA